MPPLRERGDDITELALKFINHFNMELKRNIKGLDQQAFKAIKNFHWPGNVRQLKNAIESAMIECDYDYIRVSDLPPIIKYGSTKKAEKIADDFARSGLPPLEEIKNTYIIKVLGHCRTDQEAADILGISRRTITRLKKEIGSKHDSQNVS
jgi:DNA-binding NtrC family response regulator